MKKFWCFFFMFWAAVAVLACWIAPQMGWWFPYGRGASTPLGRRIDDLFYMILWITTIAFIGTHVAIGYVLFRGARETGEKALFTHGSHNLEVIWTIVPAGILLFIALYQMDVWAEYRIQANFPEEAVQRPIAEVTARQFEWRIRYPHPSRQFVDDEGNFDQQAVNAWLRQPAPDDLHAVNDLRVPYGKPRMIYLRTEDVQHSFFLPELRVKQDAVPGLVIPIWFEVVEENPDKKQDAALGGYVYQWTCAELCGWGHYKMNARVVASNDSAYSRYLNELAAEQSDDGFPDDATNDATTGDGSDESLPSASASSLPEEVEQ